MKHVKFIFTLALFFSTTSFAQKADVFTPFKERIKSGCIRSMGNNSSKSQICECIASRHITLAKKDTDRASELVRLQWTVQFYEAKSEAAADKLMNQQPSYSDLDMQIVDECY